MDGSVEITAIRDALHDIGLGVASGRLDGIEDALNDVESRLQALDLAEQAVADLEHQLTQARRAHAETSANLRALHSRRSVKIALRSAERASPLLGAAKAGRNRLRALRTARATRTARKTLARTRPGSSRTSGPLVSIVVLSRNGADHLRALFDGLATTTYRSFEVIVIDNNSSDATAEIVEAESRFRVARIHNDHNPSFSKGCNQGVEAAEGSLVLFLNNDVRPLTDGWLGAMVDRIEMRADVAAVGALLVYPEIAQGATTLGVQHFGIRFSWEDDGPRPRNIQGSDATAPAFASDRLAPAVTAACLLARTEDLAAVDGFTEGYVYGWEDVDLCLKLNRSNRSTLVCADALLTHEEFGTQRLLTSAERRSNRLRNARLFWDRWLPQLGQGMLREQLRDGGNLSTVPCRSAVITVSNNDQAAGFGDWYTAHELGGALTEIGWSVGYIEKHKERWHSGVEPVSMVVSLLPDYDVRTAPDGALRVAWVRNWVDRWLNTPWFESYDLVFTSTDAFRSEIEQRSAVWTELMPLAANAERFSPGPSSVTLEADYTFNGNTWSGGRRLLDLISPDPSERFTVFGKNWDSLPRAQRWWRGHLPYAEMVDLYRSVKIVLDDTAAPNVPALNSRVFDALASGSLVLTDNIGGSDEWFGGHLPTYHDRESLRSQLDRYLGDDDLRADTVARLRREVLERHTYAHRANQLVTAIDATLDRPSIGIRIGPPGADVAERWGDTHFARSFAKALRRIGYGTTVSLLPEWDNPRHQLLDVVVHVRGLIPSVPKPGHLNALWIISHPDDVSIRECERFDIVFVASETFARELSAKTDVPVVPLLQATDLDVFSPQPADPDLACDLLFLGNSRGVMRPSVALALDLGLDLHIYGWGWDGIVPRRIVKADHFPNRDAARLYSSARVVLNDHWEAMAEHGFISNRVFDVAACGGSLVTDAVPGIDSLGLGGIHQYTDRDGFAAAIEAIPVSAERAAPAGIGQHSFDARAREFSRSVDALRRPNE